MPGFHCAIPKLPSIVPSCLWASLIATGSTLDSTIRLPTIPAACFSVNPLDKKKYLQAPSEAQEIWAKRLGSTSKLRVGFVCSGNPKHSNDAGRSLNMATFVDMLPVGPEYHLLQKDLRDTDIAAIKWRNDIIRHDHNIDDFADTAALCNHMDLVVSVDTSVAHLAGAIGKKTLLLLAWWPDWRWGLDGTSNIWYPNMVSLRQVQFGDWSHVLQKLGNEICSEMTKNEAMRVS